ncbi:hypothetical protein BDR26DRAFT_943378 [Obelidium mucronatum]|nr:hypothetical protein BDR26DRAFT_943378 [Obelidium mucronatum]
MLSSPASPSNNTASPSTNSGNPQPVKHCPSRKKPTIVIDDTSSSGSSSEIELVESANAKLINIHKAHVTSRSQNSTGASAESNSAESNSAAILSTASTVASSGTPYAAKACTSLAAPIDLTSSPGLASQSPILKIETNKMALPPSSASVLTSPTSSTTFSPIKFPAPRVASHKMVITNTDVGVTIKVKCVCVDGIVSVSSAFTQYQEQLADVLHHFDNEADCPGLDDSPLRFQLLLQLPSSTASVALVKPEPATTPLPPSLSSSAGNESLNGKRGVGGNTVSEIHTLWTQWHTLVFEKNVSLKRATSEISKLDLHAPISQESYIQYDATFRVNKYLKANIKSYRSLLHTDNCGKKWVAAEVFGVVNSGIERMQLEDNDVWAPVTKISNFPACVALVKLDFKTMAGKSYNEGVFADPSWKKVSKK